MRGSDAIIAAGVALGRIGKLDGLREEKEREMGLGGKRGSMAN
jgi:hypothetical protein